MSTPTPADKPALCAINHPAFAVLGIACFRKSEADGRPAVIVPLGDREAAVPIQAFQRELGITDDSPDGRMLALVTEALDYVAGLAIGDRLPREVLDGGASWDPEPRHVRLAMARLQRQLLAWLRPDAAMSPLTPDALLALDDDPAMRAQVQTAFAEAARELGLPGPSGVISGLEALAAELAYIEALRDRLMLPVQDIVQRLRRLRPIRITQDLHHSEMLKQVERLATIGMRQLAGRFRDVDGHTGEVIAALRNAESQRSFIRSNRDWLYRNARAWEPVIEDWGQARPELDNRVWQLLARTYQFLAPRYMPVKEWQSLHAPRTAKPVPMMTW